MTKTLGDHPVSNHRSGIVRNKDKMDGFEKMKKCGAMTNHQAENRTITIGSTESAGMTDESCYDSPLR